MCKITTAALLHTGRKTFQMKKLVPIISTILILTTSCASTQTNWGSVLEEVTKPKGENSNSDVIAGLKEALTIGAENSALSASALDGFWKNDLVRIPFPEEAVKVKNTLNDIGMNAQVEQFEMTLNRAAEDASKEAATIFVAAIKDINVEDGYALLTGGDHAATEFLQNKTTASLQEKFTPIVKASIDKVELTKYWEPLASKYNTVAMFTGGKAVEPDLTGYVTQQAIDGLFVLIAKEEEKIRKDPAAQVTDLLKRVFGG